ncbi:S9 family peptidase [Aureibacter tunicatorum]|uniref:Proline-specific endopeptidase n=1 Tax=Aureibacter tunicatorum TaxID=866807 RepID=A0AAE3XLV3_9BACT|nr:S9 family peptidase [Aureibacter tunicatorum]MDR6238822.1 oligopeptidase B [Aureibacter tunicatorum]BDD05251.1 oligopeptidase B [Aureibacter tunicatorum]
MKKYFYSLNFLIFATGALFLSSCNDEKSSKRKARASLSIEAPDAAKSPKELEAHGHVRVDEYYWLNQREDEKVLSYLRAENDYADKVMKHTDEFQTELFEEIKGRIKQTDMSVPYQYKGYYYYTRYEDQKEYPIYCRKKGSLDGQEEVIFNVNDLAEGYAYYNLGTYEIGPKDKIVAYSEDTVSRRIYSIKFKDLKTGEILKDEIPNTSGGITWAMDGKTVFYSVKDDALRSYKIFRHKIGTDVSDDVMVFHEADETFGTYIYRTKSDKYLVIGSHSTMTSEQRVLEADNPEGEFRIIQPRTRGLEYGINHYGDKFYIVTNHEAKNFKVMQAPENKTSVENWTDLIPHREDVFIENIEIFKNYLVLIERKNGLTNLRVKSWDGKLDYDLEFNDPAYLAYSNVNLDFDTDVLRYYYTSLTTPGSIYDFNMNTKEQELLKQQEVLGGKFSVENYVSERVYITARDGKKIPASIVYRKGIKKDGKNPLLLYGYGSYGASMDPYFSSSRLSLLDRGFVYVLAHIRGGQELGRNWYEDGKLMNKKNTFTDFIDCAEYLVSEKYTSNDKIAAMGGSAGGLLMGAVVNMRPDLFKAVVAHVPFVDVVTTMLDESIPLTTGEYDEWGNPNDKEYYEYMLSYSPYDNVKKADYPAMLVTTGLHDSQVQYWEPAKWVAKLRDNHTGSAPIILKTNMETGHGGASGRFESYKETALEYAFLIDQLSE